MSGSPLDYVNSQKFRTDLLTRNLKPYSKSPVKANQPIDYEYVGSNYVPVDTPDTLIDDPILANNLYRLNQWGEEGGFKPAQSVTGLLQQKSNQGPYGPYQQNAKLLDEGLPIARSQTTINSYSNGAQFLFDGAEFVSSLETPQNRGYYNNQPYPSTFVPSSYSPVSILLNPDPQGSNGLLSQDSYIVKLGAFTLRREFEERIAAQIRKQTLGRANILNANSGSDIINIILGKVPILEPNYQITVPANPILAATDFILRLGGSIIPVSPIPGSYFDPSINSGQPTTIQQLQNAFRESTVGNFFNRLLGGEKTGSQIFYENTGEGQKSILFQNINYNKYKPSYQRNIFDRGAGVLRDAVSDNANFYIGSITSNPSRISSPGGEIPIDTFGREIQANVYGPSELAKLYEGPDKEIRLGAYGPIYSDGGGIEGGLTWVSPKYKGNAGKKVGVGGEVTVDDENFRPSSYNKTESTNIQFREGSILDDTQRIINSQPQGGRRLQHVGNAIDQVSKVFHDGYKEITKGSKVITYVGEIGQEVGTEYCRVFAKDIPYLQYNNLQKTDGVTTEGRRFSWSVLDKTYNLNMYPNKQEGGQSSSNLINGAGGLSTNVGYAKKYMFSIENLSWRTSNTPGYSVSDLPMCERGPNGGRVMWFPPYELKFSETVTPNFKSNDFIGRPEPVYTYQNTTRTGSLSWKIVVDHPSVLNLIVNKVLNNETNKERVNSILTSFFAGCRKYDLYELAKKYYTVNPNDLWQLQQIITSKELSTEQLQFTKKTIQTGNNSPTGADTPTNQQSSTIGSDYFSKYKQVGFYFDNGVPTQENTNFQITFDSYTATTTRNLYNKKSTAQETSNFFDKVIIPNFQIVQEMCKDIAKVMSETDGTLTIIINSSCSAPATKDYNLKLSKRRISSVITYLTQNPLLSTFISNQRLTIKEGVGLGETATSQPIEFNGADVNSGKPRTSPIYCSTSAIPAISADTIQNGDKVNETDVFTYQAMGCRRAFIDSFVSSLTTKPTTTNQENQTASENTQIVLQGNVVTGTKKVPVVEETWVQRDNITKRVLRSLLTECDYFEVIKEETPMVFDSIKDQLKFFSPTFHSTTPEGLNSRLTFLQQCMRPGDTIPVIKEVNGSQTLQFDNATNTSFGAPPVLILRVGDFYNTKIIPTSLQLSYETLDFNPEGIGVQPMIATVQMGFNFVGGSGLKNSIDKLQNSLTFNYYANTEMWDDRADVSDDSYVALDTDFLAAVAPQGPPTVNQVQQSNGQTNNGTIGTILTEETGDFVTGTTSYSEYLEKFKNETQTYFQGIINKIKEVQQQYNNAMRQQWLLNRNYVYGRLNGYTDDIQIFGKPINLESRIQEIAKLHIEEIKNGTDSYIAELSKPENNFSNSVKRQLKTNYENHIKNISGTFINAATTITQNVVNLQQNYLQTLSRINILGYNINNRGTDGFQSPKGDVTIYDIYDGETLYSDLLIEINKVYDALKEYNTILITPQTLPGKTETAQLVYNVTQSNGVKEGNPITNDDVFIPYTDKFTNLTFRKEYLFVSNEVIDSAKFQTFKTSLIGNILTDTSISQDEKDRLDKSFDNYWNVAKSHFVSENKITLDFIDIIEKNNLKDYIKFTPYESVKCVLNYTSQIESTDPSVIKSKKEFIDYLDATQNAKTDNKWSDEAINGTSAGAFFPKVKLN